MVLVVGVSDSVWLNELNYLKKDILRKMSRNTILARFCGLQFVFDKRRKDKGSNKKEKGRDTLEFSNYQKKSKDLLASLQIPSWVKEKMSDYLLYVLGKND